MKINFVRAASIWTFIFSISKDKSSYFKGYYITILGFMFLIQK